MCICENQNNCPFVKEAEDAIGSKPSQQVSRRNLSYSLLHGAASACDLKEKVREIINSPLKADSNK